MNCNFLVHGIRHIPEESIRVDGNNVRLSADALEAHLSALRPGDPLRVLDQPDNDYNPKAILTTTVTDQPLGWVPDLLVDEVHRIPNRGSVNVTVQVVNGPEAVRHLRLLAHWKLLSRTIFLYLTVPDGSHYRWVRVDQMAPGTPTATPD